MEKPKQKNHPIPDTTPDTKDTPLPTPSIPTTTTITEDPLDLSQYEARFHRQLQVLRDLGFRDERENIRALLRSGGKVAGAVEWLMTRQSL